MNSYIPEGSYAANDSLEVTSQQAAEHTAYLDSLNLQELSAYQEAYHPALFIAARHFMTEVIDHKDAVITEQENLMRDMMYSSEHDKLTGLLNKSAWQKDVEARMISGKPVVIYLLDLDAFKAVNDTFGHDRGDDLLKAFSNRLSSKFKRESDAIAHESLPASMSRWGGDEFAIVSSPEDRTPVNEQEPREPKSLTELVDTETNYLQDVIDEFVAEQSQEIRDVGFNISLGTAVWDPETAPEMTAAELFRKADVMMYLKKNMPFQVLKERHRDELETVYSILADLGIDPRNLAKVNPYED